MAEIRVPALGESVTEATIGKWFKHSGDTVAVDEPLVELETDKVTIEVPAPATGVLSDIAAKDGDTVAVGARLGEIKEGAAATIKPGKAAAAPTGRPDKKTDTTASIGAGPEQPQPRAQTREESPVRPAGAAAPLAPSVRKLAAETGLDPASVAGSGRDGRLTKADMLAAIERA